MQAVGAVVEVALVALLVVVAARLARLGAWAWGAGRIEAPPPAAPTTRAVTVQLPLRNEMQMAEGVVRAAAALEGERIEIQVLDDSDDETSVLLDRVTAELGAAPHDVRILRRRDRRGYKAGNLAEGLKTASGELVLVLDADFRPEPDLVSRLAAVLEADPQLAFAQGRWTFRDDSAPLRRVQAAILDALFVVEQAQLTERGAPVQFNGTAGLWRRAAIERAGGWSTTDDALTEDLDLSFRAWESGLRGVTRVEVAVSTELPADRTAFRVQQARWVRGGALTLRALGNRLVRRASARDALTILSHLARHARQPLLVAALLRLPLVALGVIHPVMPGWLSPLAVGLALVATALYLGAASWRVGHGPVRGLAQAIPLALVSAGLAPALSVAFVGGLLGRRGAGFVRTPKGGARVVRSLDASVVLAALVGVGCLVALGVFAWHGDVSGSLAALLGAAGIAWVGL